MAETIIKWEKMGVEFVYDVWYATNINGPWIRHNQTLLTDYTIDWNNRYENPAFQYSNENTYTIDGLKNNTKYFFKVSCDDRYYQWWYSYSDVDSIEGGYGSVFDQPESDGGNYRLFQINIATPWAEGPWGDGSWGG